MNKYTVYILICSLVFLWSCKQTIDFPYEGKDRIQFQHYFVDWNGNRHYSDSTVFSFGLIPDEIQQDTLKIPVEYLGKGSDRIRNYLVSTDVDSTTAIEGVHYIAFDEKQTFRSNNLTDTLYIIILRKSLPNDYTSHENIRLVLRMESSNDFDLGLQGGLQKKILLNNYLSEPGWWQENLGGMFGFFHPKKWKFLIEKLDDKLATYGDIPYDQNSPETKSYLQSMDSYLRHNIILDDKTGMRVTMNGLEPIE